MSETRWAPGPWQAYPTIETGREPPYTPVGANTLLGKVYSEGFGDYDESRANANLIAAAPDLYEALAQCLALAELKYSNTDDIASHVFGECRVALSKARGEQ